MKFKIYFLLIMSALAGCSPAPENIIICDDSGGLSNTHTARGTIDVAVAYCNDGSVKWQKY